jgi:hypothetical protein
MTAASIPLDRIDVGSGRRALSRPAVKALAASMAEVGLLAPICVQPVGAAYELIAGQHRVEAARALGWTEIAAVMVDLDAIGREIAEIDENLVRHNLTAADECRQTARRKDLYLLKHPETKQGGLPGVAGGGKAKTATIAAFAADTAEKTGRAERSVRMDAQIGKSIPDDVFEAIQDTPLEDSKTDLLALAKLPEAEQRAVVAEVDLGDKQAVRQAIADRRPSPGPAPEPEAADEPAIHTTEVQTTVEAFALAALALFEPDECRRLIRLIHEGLP